MVSDAVKGDAPERMAFSDSNGTLWATGGARVAEWAGVQGHPLVMRPIIYIYMYSVGGGKW